MTPRLRVRPGMAAIAVGITGVLLFPGIPGTPAAAADSTVTTGTADAVPQPVSAADALTQAEKTGQPVLATAYTTTNSTLTAEPDGTFGYSESVQPARKRVAGVWHDLDATLRRNTDGTVSPTLSSVPLTLGGAGSTRLVTQDTGPSAIGINLPFTLPEPQLSGDTATYPDVLDGVDLVVTADELGGFSEVFVVDNATAAASPELKSLTLGVDSDAVTVAKDGDNIALDNSAGDAIETLPTPQMWDSAAPDTSGITTATDPETGTLYDVGSGQPAESTPLAPSEDAHVADLGTAVTADGITLAPDKNMLTSASTVWPLYIDPSFTEPNFTKSRASWATVRSDHPSTVYLNTSDALRVGYQGWDSPYFKARSFIRFTLPSYYYKADTVKSATVTVQETYSPSCSKREVDLWHTSTITNSSDKPTWNNQPTWYDKLDSATVAHGYSSSCTVANVGFDSSAVLAHLKTASAGSESSITFGLRAADETDEYGWKKFSHAASLTTLYVVYDHAPTTPTTSTMSTNPTTARSTSTTCKSSPTGETTVGKGSVSFIDVGKDPDSDTSAESAHVLGYEFQVYKTSTGKLITYTDPTSNSYKANPGVAVTFKVAKTAFTDVALDSSGAAAITDFYWRVRLYDGYLYSGWGPSCHFLYDPTVPGPPDVTPPDTTPVIGAPASFAVAPADPDDPPVKYQYRINGGAWATVTADGNGNATATPTPTRLKANILDVIGVSAGGNMGGDAQTNSLPFDADPPATYADADFDGDGVADVLTVGTASATPAPGLWLAAGTGSAGALDAKTTNIGTNGNGINNPGTADDFTGARVVTGAFTGGSAHGGLQDAFVYYPSTGTIQILPGNGDGTLQEPADNAINVSSESAPLTNDTGNLFTQFVNAGKTSASDSAPDFPDLLGTASPDGTTQALYIIPAINEATYTDSFPLTNTTPTGDTDWTNWQLVSTQEDSGTALYLWNTSTKALYLWTNLTTVSDEDAGTFTLTGNQYTISTNWNPGSTNTVQAANLNSDTIADLRVTRTTGTATAYLVSSLPTATALGTPGTTTATITAQTTQTLTW